MVSTEGKPQDEKHQRDNQNEIDAKQHNKDETNHPICENQAISQRIADGNMAIKGHRHQHNRLHGSEYMNEEHLGDTALKANLLEIKPEYAQHFGDSGCGQAQINGG